MSDPDPPDEPPVDWQMTTFAGARREQLRRWSELSLRQILEAQEEMQELALRFVAGAGDPPGRGSGGD